MLGTVENVRGHCDRDGSQIGHVVKGRERLAVERRGRNARWKLVPPDTMEDYDPIVVPQHDECTKVVGPRSQVVKKHIRLDGVAPRCRTIGAAHISIVTREVITVGIRQVAYDMPLC
jgi:hypothetical protein